MASRSRTDGAELVALQRAATLLDDAGDALLHEPLLRGLVHAALGEDLRRQGRRREAAAHLLLARSAFAAAGAATRLERCDQELAACGAEPGPRGLRDRTRLTPQEAAVARLVARGCTNREAAAELRISVKTVEYHLGHVFDKLGLHHRAQLAALLAGGPRA